MNELDRKLRQMAAEEKIKMPDHVQKRMEATLHALPTKETKRKRLVLLPRIAAAAACVVFVFIFIMPNVSVVYAQSMEKIPVIGDLIRVVTIRNYLYSDSTHDLNINVPSISDEDNTSAADRVNDDVDRLTQKLMQQFYDDLGGIGKQGHGSIYVDYDVLTNTDRWFTLRLSVQLISGSSNHYFEYYHVDRATGKTVKLADLFNTEDFNQILTDHIKAQMYERMEKDESVVYFADDAEFGHDCAYVGDEHNFYFNDNGDLVIPFDKYEVAPGYMGNPEFTIKLDDIQGILKDEFKNINSVK